MNLKAADRSSRSGTPAADKLRIAARLPHPYSSEAYVTDSQWLACDRAGFGKRFEGDAVMEKRHFICPAQPSHAPAPAISGAVLRNDGIGVRRKSRIRYVARASRLVLLASLAAPVLAGCKDDTSLRQEALREARAKCNVGRSATIIMPEMSKGIEKKIVLKIFFAPSDARARCLRSFTSKLGYTFQPISIGDFPEAPE